MKPKYQISKYSIQKIREMSKCQQIPQMLTAYLQIVQERTKKLKNRRNELFDQLNKIRQNSQNIVYDMVDGVKDRIEKVEQMIMDEETKPSKNDMKELVQLFTYMLLQPQYRENQNKLIKKNSLQMCNLQNLIQEFLQNTSHVNMDIKSLDEQFIGLQNQYKTLQIQRKQLIKKREQHQNKLETIKSATSQQLITYNKLQTQIVDWQRELDRLGSYFRTRQDQDREKIQYQNSIANKVEANVLIAQSTLNEGCLTGRDLKIKEHEEAERKRVSGL